MHLVDIMRCHSDEKPLTFAEKYVERANVPQSVLLAQERASALSVRLVLLDAVSSLIRKAKNSEERKALCGLKEHLSGSTNGSAKR